MDSEETPEHSSKIVEENVKGSRVFSLIKDQVKKEKEQVSQNSTKTNLLYMKKLLSTQESFIPLCT